MAAAVEKGEKDMEQTGYLFEQLILYATSLGLGTCWLGGTFQRSSLEKAAGVKKNELLPAISPVGYGKKSKRLIETAMKLAARSKKRKSWQELFFQAKIGSPLQQREAGPFSRPLEMVRLAPSALNRQPWRIVKAGAYWHFYMAYSPVINKGLGINFQRIDMGIAMCHFELSALEEGLPGSWEVHNIKPSVPGTDKLHYIATWCQAPYLST